LFNPFMGYRDRVDRRRAEAQWWRLVGALEEAGAELELMAPAPVSAGLPFTSDGAFVYAPGQAVVLRNDGPRGEVEPPIFTRWLRYLGYATEALPPRYRIDGGNLIRLQGGDVIAGMGPRQDGLAERYLGRLLQRVTGHRLWTVELSGDRYIHLDTVVGFLDRETCLVHLDGLARLPASGPLAEAEVIPVGADDAARFACNVVVAGDVVITGSISARLKREIARRGFHVECVDLSEFNKAGGGARCLSLALS
jgi:N-dimethylarginine dimethylaminohydrolase